MQTIQASWDLNCALPGEARLSLRATRSDAARRGRPAQWSRPRPAPVGHGSSEPASIDSSSTPESDEDTGSFDGPGDLTADGDRDRPAMGRLDDASDRPKDRRMERIAVGAQRGIGAVRGEQVLGEVVRADAHEGDPPSQLVGQPDRGWDLDHDPRDKGLGRQPIAAAERQGRLGAQAVEDVDVLERRDHRRHDVGSGPGRRRSAGDRPDLTHEQLGTFRREPDRAHAQERIGFSRQPEVWHLLVAADVGQSDHDGAMRPNAARIAWYARACSSSVGGRSGRGTGTRSGTARHPRHRQPARDRPHPARPGSRPTGSAGRRASRQGVRGGWRPTGRRPPRRPFAVRARPDGPRHGDRRPGQ